MHPGVGEGLPSGPRAELGFSDPLGLISLSPREI